MSVWFVVPFVAMAQQPKQNENPTIHALATDTRDTDSPLKTGFHGGPFPFDASDLFPGAPTGDAPPTSVLGMTAASFACPAHFKHAFASHRSQSGSAHRAQ